MRKLIYLMFFLGIGISCQAQFKILRFGLKGGINYPQANISTQDLIDLYTNQNYDISNVQTDVSNGFNFGAIARVAVPLIPAYIHGEALYTQFSQNLLIVDGGQEVDMSTTVQRFDFPISAGMKFGPAWAGLGATPSIPVANANDIWSQDTEAQFSWGWHVHSGLKIWRLMAEIKYEGGFGMLAQNVAYTTDAGTTYDFNLDARNSQLVVSVAYLFK